MSLKGQSIHSYTKTGDYIIIWRFIMENIHIEFNDVGFSRFGICFIIPTFFIKFVYDLCIGLPGVSDSKTVSVKILLENLYVCPLL